MPEPGTVQFDPDAAAAYNTNATQVIDLLRDAATQVDTAAGVDLSAGLGLLGADFVTAWRTALASQSGTLGMAADLVAGYIATITAAGNALTATDDNTAAALAAAPEVNA